MEEQESVQFVSEQSIGRSDCSGLTSTKGTVVYRDRFAARCLVRMLLVASLTGLSSMWAFTAGISAFTEPGITAGFADFANCPVNVAASAAGICLHSYTTGGVVQIGHSSVPISVPGDTFDVGVAKSPAVCALVGAGVPECVVSPPHGILNGPAQPVPGGLLGVVGNVQLTGVMAKLEWAVAVPAGMAFGRTSGCGSSDSLAIYNECVFLNGKAGTAATLIAKIHLMSPFLGQNCFIGSAAKPIVIQLTTGITNPPPPAHPIHGKPFESLQIVGAVQVPGVTLVNNSFSVPAATGCGTSNGSLVTASINHKLGLPSPPGQNMIVINATGEQRGAAEVLAHGWTGE